MVWLILMVLLINWFISVWQPTENTVLKKRPQLPSPPPTTILPGSMGIDICDPIKASSIVAKGYKFVCRYINPTQPDFSTQLTIAEYRDLTAVGLGVILIWEVSPTRALEGGVAGRQDAADARDVCTRLGLNQLIYFTVDCEVTESDFLKVNEYFKAIQTVIPLNRIGVYGGLPVVKYCLDNQLVSAAWQTFAWSGGKNDKQADSGTQWDPRINIKQIRIDSDYLDGVGIDFNTWVK